VSKFSSAMISLSDMRYGSGDGEQDLFLCIGVSFPFGFSHLEFGSSLRKMNPLFDSLPLPFSNTSSSASQLSENPSDKQHFVWIFSLFWPVNVPVNTLKNLHRNSYWLGFAPSDVVAEKQHKAVAIS
jgi:hypothetical protein